MTAHAPLVPVRLLAEAAADTHDLARGHVDLEVGATEPSASEISYEVIGHDRMVAAMRADHPLAAGALTLERFASADHVTVSRRGRLGGVIDDALADRGLHRRVVASLPTKGAGLHLAAHSDVVVVVAERLCRSTCPTLGLETRLVPLKLPTVPLIMAWHSRYGTDPAHGWLRTQVQTALGALLRQP